MTRTGFIGLGAMGLPMASRISRDGFDLIVVDVDARQVEKAAGLGLDATSDLDRLAVCDTVLVIVANGTQLLSLARRLFLRPGSNVRTVVTLSTVGVETVREFAEVVARSGIAVVDAPVTGGITGAESGELTLFTSGDTGAIERIRPVVRSLGSMLICGKLAGDGQSLKLVNQLLAASHLAVAGEAIAFGRALGLDPELVLAAVTAGAGASWMLADRGPRMVLSGRERPTLTRLSILRKDASLVQHAAAAAHFDARIFGQVADEFRRADAAGFADDDDSSIVDIDRGVTPAGR